MHRSSLSVALVGSFLGFFGAEGARGAVAPDEAGMRAPVADDPLGATDTDVTTLDELESLVVPLPEARQIHTHVYRNGVVTSTIAEAASAGAAARADLPGEKLIYSNTNGNKIFRFVVPNRRYADDLQTDALSGCNLSRYAVRVNGGVMNGTGEFSCTIGLYIDCPPPRGTGALIPGTNATFAGLTDDSTVFHDLVLDLSATPISIPVNLWVQVSCDTGPAGWVGGAPAEVGFTQDVFSHPSVGCNSFLGPSFFSGFFVQIWASSDPLAHCQTHFVAYATKLPTSWLGGNVSNIKFADDFQTALASTGESCILSAYEVAARGFAGPFNLKTELRSPFTVFPISGTEWTFQGRGDGSLEFTRRTVDPAFDILVPATPLWLAWEVDKSSSSLMLADGAAIGFTDPYFVYWNPFIPPGVIQQGSGTFYLNVYCRGEVPTGSCCSDGDLQSDPLCIDDSTVLDCIGHRWMKDARCANDPFDPPCGYGACCTPQDKCLDTLEEGCAAIGGRWNPAEVCATAGPKCGLFACRNAEGECNQSHDSPGCNVPTCCNSVCAVDPTCCSAAWNVGCLRLAANTIECSILPQGNYCAPITSVPNNSAVWVDAQTEFSLDNSNSQARPTFCCGTPFSGSVGGIYLRFIATHTSAWIHTCDTVPSDAGNSLLQVYRVGNSSTEASACSSLFTISCNDDSPGCGDAGTMSDLCVTGLAPGETYYFTLASKTYADQGIYRVVVESPCPAEQLAGPCHEGIVQWLAPTSGQIVDARQPFDPSDPAVSQGVTTLTVRAPFNADDPACWTVCDTLGNPLDNEVLTVEDHGDGTQTLHLTWPLTPGATTTVAYVNNSGCTSTSGRFKFLPGDGGSPDNAVATDDASNFGFNCLSGQPGTNMERCDIDRSGDLSSDDLIRLIDLMNGAGPFDPWLGRTVSTAPCE